MYHFLEALSRVLEALPGARVRLAYKPDENIFSLDRARLGRYCYGLGLAGNSTTGFCFLLDCGKADGLYEGADPARYRRPATAQGGKESPPGLSRGRAADSSGSYGLRRGILAVSFGDGPDARVCGYRTVRALASMDRAGRGVASHCFGAGGLWQGGGIPSAAIAPSARFPLAPRPRLAKRVLICWARRARSRKSWQLSRILVADAQGENRRRHSWATLSAAKTGRAKKTDSLPNPTRAWNHSWLPYRTPFLRYHDLQNTREQIGICLELQSVHDLGLLQNAQDPAKGCIECADIQDPDRSSTGILHPQGHCQQPGVALAGSQHHVFVRDRCVPRAFVVVVAGPQPLSALSRNP